MSMSSYNVKMNLVKPTYAVESIAAIDPYLFHELHPEIEALAFDLDKTLVGQHDRVVSHEQLEPLLVWGGELGLKLAIGSNAGPKRAARAIEIGLYVGQQVYATQTTENGIIVVCSADVGNRRKPDPAIFEEIARLIEVEPPHIAFVGDQLVRDTSGAEAAGYGVQILVKPYGKGENIGTRLVRMGEAAIRPFLGLPFSARKFPKQLQPQPTLV